MKLNKNIKLYKCIYILFTMVKWLKIYISPNKIPLFKN